MQNISANLANLYTRLEAATSRLEDIATSTELPKNGATPVTSIDASSSPAQLPPPPTEAPKAADEPLPAAVEDYDAFLETTIGKYVQSSDELGGLVAKQAALVAKAFHEQRKLLLIASKAKKPDDATLGKLVEPMNGPAMEAMNIKEENRGSDQANHLSTVADGIMLLGWVFVPNRPFKHVDEFLGSAQFWGNKVLKQYKETDPKHVEWVQSFYGIFKNLSELIKDRYPNGLTWNANGESAVEVAKSLDSKATPAAPAPAAGGAPPPPPPPPPPGPPPTLDVKTEPAAPAAPSGGSGFGAVFSELNKGESVTKGLRKVDKSEMTHKNPSLRTSSTVGDGSSASRAKSPAPGKKPKPQSMRVKKPAKKELEGNKWTIENYEKEAEPVTIDAALSHSVLISRCNNTTIIVKGKANQVTVENSSRLSLVVDTLVSTVDVVKAPNFALQVLGTIPTVMLDQVDGASVYLSKESIATKIFSSKSDSINLNIIEGEDDYKEVPLPSQLCSYYDESKGQLVNEIVDHAG
ncbi:putative adenylate cyclase-associated protein, 70K [Emericellopsis atlantica]|uniref:Adenylyl cyclase-associated protein n=1 Tax=Emericellopsis atlantica TaxID=2614577 RepID=A0A9P7ZTJ2_9HYPO|nr:putative adenylate cyclase-associated protein, 70K [Emericellopsis atlantica]KAG9257556.1 putative adenylate cyclase-associated protein, 70K [Emericellopsis atlantica]